MAVFGNVEDVGHKAAAVMAVCFGPDMERAGAGLLKQLCEFDRFFNRCAAIAQTEFRHILFHRAEENLDDEIIAHSLTDSLDDFRQDAAAVFDACPAVLVLALIVDSA